MLIFCLLSSPCLAISFYYKANSKMGYDCVVVNITNFNNKNFNRNVSLGDVKLLVYNPWAWMLISSMV
jgi:hypothetical protein